MENEAERKFYKTVIKIEVLSEDPYEYTDLENLSYDINEGDCSGKVTIESSQELSKEQTKEELVKQGSDPNFLLNEDEDSDE